MPVDFPTVMKNAAAEGVDLQQIAITYRDLTAEEAAALEAHQEVTHGMGTGSVMAKFPADGSLPLFPEKAVGCLYLGA